MMATTFPVPAAERVAVTKKQNITLSLSKQTLQKARVIAAKQGKSISGLLTDQIEKLAEDDETYEQVKARALARLKSGFTLGPIGRMSREELHDRKAARDAAAEEYAG
jgi:hypothetical protein